MWFLCEMKYILPKDRPWFSCPSKSHFWRWLPLGPLNIQTNWPTTVDSVSKFLLREQITKTKKNRKTNNYHPYSIWDFVPRWDSHLQLEGFKQYLNQIPNLTSEKSKIFTAGEFVSRNVFKMLNKKHKIEKTNKLTTNCWLSVQIPTGETFVSGKTTWF